MEPRTDDESRHGRGTTEGGEPIRWSGIPSGLVSLNGLATHKDTPTVRGDHAADQMEALTNLTTGRTYAGGGTLATLPIVAPGRVVGLSARRSYPRLGSARTLVVCFCRLLFVVVWYLVFAFGYLLFAACCLLFVGCCSLFVVVCCLLFAGCHSLCVVVCCWLSVVLLLLLLLLLLLRPNALSK